MYFVIKTSKRNVKSHLEYNKQISKGTKFVKIDNGTIGKGARSCNVPLELILQDYTTAEILEALTLSRLKETKSIDHVYDSTFLVNEKEEVSLDFCADDIPF